MNRTTASSGSKAGFPALSAPAVISALNHGFVLVAVKPGTKEPIEKWKKGTGGPIRFRSAEELCTVNAWRGRIAVSVLSGPSGIVGIDTDAPGAWEVLYGWAHAVRGRCIPETFELKTTHGRQLWFRNPPGREFKTCAGEEASGLDVRGRDGTLKLWDPTEPGRYIVRDVKPLEIPSWISRHLSAPGDPAPGSGNGHRAGLDLATLLSSGIEPGQQDHLITSLGMKWRAEKQSRETFILAVSGILSKSVTGKTASGSVSPKGPWTAESIGAKWDSADAKISAEESELAGLRDYWPARSVSAEEKEFWDSLPVLRHIRDSARSARCAPWGVFGEVIVEAICHTPPGLVLPALVGGYGTPNLLVALTADSGIGKNSVGACARLAFSWEGILGVIPDIVPRIPLGSGEGLAKNYGFIQKGEDGRPVLFRSCWSAITTIPEIDTFSAIQGRSGSTISPELRKLYSGEDLGFGWSDASKRVIISAGSYRGCVLCGVQPGRADVILSDVEGGFAQRWLWLPVRDPAMPDSAPSAPLPWVWTPPPFLFIDEGGSYVMKVCESARVAVEASLIARHRGAVSGLSAHTLYTRLKVAAGIALLCGSDLVDDTFWELSGYVMKVSDLCRADCAGHLARVAHSENVSRGHAEGVRRLTSETVVVAASVSRVAANCLKKIPGRGQEGIPSNVLRRSLPARDRELMSDAMDLLADSGKVIASPFVYQGRDAVRYNRK